MRATPFIAGGVIALGIAAATGTVSESGAQIPVDTSTYLRGMDFNNPNNSFELRKALRDTDAGPRAYIQSHATFCPVYDDTRAKGPKPACVEIDGVFRPTPVCRDQIIAHFKELSVDAGIPTVP